MSSQRFSIGKEFLWQNDIYEVKRLRPGSYLKIENVRTAESRTISFSELVQALFDGTLHFLEEGTPLSPATHIDRSDYSPSQNTIADYRLEIIRPLLCLRYAERTRAALVQRVEEVKAAQEAGEMPKISISVASVYRWLRDYEKGGKDIRTLVPQFHKRGGKMKQRLSAEVDAIVDDVMQKRFYVRERVKVDDLLHEVVVRVKEANEFRPKDDQLVIPSRTTIWRRIEAQDIRSKLVGKRGRRAAKQEMTQYGQMEYPTVPLERVEIDHTRLDLIIVDANDNLPLGRLTITHCLDVATRYPLGYYLGFEPPSYLTVMECLYHAILPKGNVKAAYSTEHDWLACGVPSTLVVDNAKEFTSHALQDSCNSLGIVLQFTPVKSPHFKASVERMFGTLNTGLIHTLPGTTFSNLNHRGDYDSLRYASLTLDDLNKVMHIFLLDIYAESFHKGMGGIPARQWEKALEKGFFPRVPSDVTELAILLGRTAYRTIQNSGIMLHSLRYNSPDLSLLRTRAKKRTDKRVKIKYHPGDLSRIYVHDPFDEQYIEVPALAREYTQGLSMWKHEVICSFARANSDKPDLQALGEAKRKIQQIVEESKQRKKQSGRARIARWQSSVERTADGSEAEPEKLDSRNWSLPDLNVDPKLEELEEKGWGLLG